MGRNGQGDLYVSATVLCAMYRKYTQKVTAGNRKTRQEVRDAGSQASLPSVWWARDGGFGVTQWLLETVLLKMEKPVQK